MVLLIGTACRRKSKLEPRAFRSPELHGSHRRIRHCPHPIQHWHHYGETFYPLLGTIFLYIVTCNLFGLIPGFESPTSNINMTASMAVPVFLLYQFYGLKYMASNISNTFLGPITGHCSTPAHDLHVSSRNTRSLPIRTDHTVGSTLRQHDRKHLLLLVLAMLVPAFIPIVILGLGTLNKCNSGFTFFMLLTTLYLAGAVEEAALISEEEDNILKETAYNLNAYPFGCCAFAPVASCRRQLPILSSLITMLWHRSAAPR